MAIWKWKAVDEQGNRHHGFWEDEDKKNVILYLRKQQFYPIKIRRSVLMTIINMLYSFNGKLYWANTARKFSLLLDSGISLLTVLNIIIEKETNPIRKNQWLKVSIRVNAGEDLSNSLTGFSPEPGFFFKTMLKTGERSGTLALSFRDIAEQFEEEYFFEQNIRTALFYPLLLLIVCLLEIYVLSVIVVPMYQSIFSEFNIELPFVTKFLFFFGSIIPYFLFLIPIILALSNFLKQGKYLSIPGTQKIIRYKNLVQFCTLLQRLLKAGVPLLEAIQVLRNIFKDKKVEALLDQLKRSVEEGKGISSVILTNNLFPGETAKMLAVAEESGRLNQMLGHLANMFKKELQQELKKYLKVLEPVMVFGMAGLIGVVAIGVLLPIFNLSLYIK